MKVPLSIPQTLTLLRAKFPDGVICAKCARLLATNSASYTKSRFMEGDEESRQTFLREYVCGECKSEVQEKARAFQRMRALPVKLPAAQFRQADDFCSYCKSWFITDPNARHTCAALLAEVEARRASHAARRAALPWWTGSGEAQITPTETPSQAPQTLFREVPEAVLREEEAVRLNEAKRAEKGTGGVRSRGMENGPRKPSVHAGPRALNLTLATGSDRVASHGCPEGCPRAIWGCRVVNGKHVPGVPGLVDGMPLEEAVKGRKGRPKKHATGSAKKKAAREYAKAYRAKKKTAPSRASQKAA